MEKKNIMIWILCFIVLITLYSATAIDATSTVNVLAGCNNIDTDCGTFGSCVNCDLLDNFTSSDYCNLGNVVKDYDDYSCSSQICGASTTITIIENCTFACHNAKCVLPSSAVSHARSQYVSIKVEDMFTYSDIAYPSPIFKSSYLEFELPAIENTGTLGTKLYYSMDCGGIENCAKDWCVLSNGDSYFVDAGESILSKIKCEVPSNAIEGIVYGFNLVVNGLDSEESMSVSFPIASKEQIASNPIYGDFRTGYKFASLIGMGIGAITVIGILAYITKKPKIWGRKRRKK